MYTGGGVIYREHWKLRKQPFENVNDPVFLFASSRHKEALARLRYAVEQRKMGALLTGEYGTGKTYLSRILKKLSDAARFRFIFFTNPRLTPLEFLREIHFQLAGSSDSFTGMTKAEYLRAVYSLLEQNSARGMHTVVVVDEAQSISDASLLEEIRLLLNMQSSEANLFTLVMLGQPQVEQMLDEVPQFKQRLAIRYRLSHLDEEETREYVRHRLRTAGAEKDIFTEAAYARLFALSRGMPRVINNICDLALLHAYSQQRELIDGDIVTRVGNDLGEQDMKETDNG
jgi:general secretion pathway protein A